MYNILDSGSGVKTAECLPGPDSLSSEAEAAVAGMKARFFHQYREDGARLAVQFARQALRLAPDTPLWQVLTAQCMSKWLLHYVSHY